MLLSQIAWNKAGPIYQAIIHHPFNQELREGCLSTEIFGYYIEQDSLYLKDFARALALLAARSQSLPHITTFLNFSQGALMAEQEMVHQFFKKELGFKETGKLTPTTLAYTSFLLQKCALDPVEVGVAAVLPCFWVYREVGRYIVQHANDNNPFKRWITTYSGEEFSRSVDEAIYLFDTLAANATETTRQRMCEAFYKSSVLEWHFWQDTYEMRSFDDITLETNQIKLAV